MDPMLFRTAVEDQFARLKEEKDAEQATAADEQASSSPSDQDTSASDSLALDKLSSRIEELKQMERRATVEDLMYLCVLEEFVKLGVSMLTKMDNYTAAGAVNMEPLLSGIHSQEAIDLVRFQFSIHVLQCY